MKHNDAASTTHIKLQVSDLHKSYGSHEVLKGVSLTAHAGDVISIIGSSGSGKSTFLRCINMLEHPNSGQIQLGGEELQLVADKKTGALRAANHKQLERIRTKLAMVFQHFNLWAHMTVLENIIEAPIHVLGLSRDEAIARARKYLDKVGLKDVEGTCRMPGSAPFWPSPSTPQPIPRKSSPARSAPPTGVKSRRLAPWA